MIENKYEITVEKQTQLSHHSLPSDIVLCANGGVGRPRTRMFHKYPTTETAPGRTRGFSAGWIRS